MRMASATSTGRVRDINEDCYWFNSFCAVVCDGMGGHSAGEVASQLAVETVKSHDFALDDPRQEMDRLIITAHEKIKETAAQHPPYRGMGTTMTMGLFLPYPAVQKLFYGHVGDSRAYLVRDGLLQRITRDHSVVEELIRAGSLGAAEAHLHPQRNVLTQALGVGSIAVEIGELPLHKGDIVLFCTDGLTNVVADNDIQAILSQCEIQTAAQRLVELADAAGGPDNSTVILVEVSTADDVPPETSR